MENIPILDIRHISIIDSLPVYNTKKEVLTIGCGDCKIDYHLIKMGYKVYSTDYETNDVFHNRMKDYFQELNYYHSNVFDINSFPIKIAESVICSEVLEHLINYKEAFKNLLGLTERKLIITVPYERSFNDTAPPPIGHCNYWSNITTLEFKDIHEFESMAKPYAISIQKIRTKERDIKMMQYDYLIIIDKNQKYNV
jgi:hypothetical protein